MAVVKTRNDNDDDDDYDYVEWWIMLLSNSSKANPNTLCNVTKFSEQQINTYVCDWPSKCTVTDKTITTTKRRNRRPISFLLIGNAFVAPIAFHVHLGHCAQFDVRSNNVRFMSTSIFNAFSCIIVVRRKLIRIYSMLSDLCRVLNLSTRLNKCIMLPMADGGF